MAFPDTITLTINAVAKVLTRVNSGDPYASEYRLRGTTDQYVMKIRHSTFNDKQRPGKTVNRHNVEVVHTVFAVAPSTIPTVRKTYVVYEETQDDAVTDVQKFDEGVLAFAALAANITKLLNYES